LWLKLCEGSEVHMQKLGEPCSTPERAAARELACFIEIFGERRYKCRGSCYSFITLQPSHEREIEALEKALPEQALLAMGEQALLEISKRAHAAVYNRCYLCHSEGHFWRTCGSDAATRELRAFEHNPAEFGSAGDAKSACRTYWNKGQERWEASLPRRDGRSRKHVSARVRALGEGY
jgi:hypothetical protein